MTPDIKNKSIINFIYEKHRNVSLRVYYYTNLRKQFFQERQTFNLKSNFIINRRSKNGEKNDNEFIDSSLTNLNILFEAHEG